MVTAQITCVLPVAIKTEPSACGAISGVTRHSRSPSPVRFELRRRVSGCGLISMFSVSGKRDNNAGRAKSQGKAGQERRELVENLTPRRKDLAQRSRNQR